MDRLGCRPQSSDTQRKEHRFNEQPQETDVVTAVACEHFPDQKRSQHAELDAAAIAEGMLIRGDGHQSRCSRMPTISIDKTPQAKTPSMKVAMTFLIRWGRVA